MAYPGEVQDSPSLKKFSLTVAVRQCYAVAHDLLKGNEMKMVLKRRGVEAMILQVSNSLVPLVKFNHVEWSGDCVPDGVTIEWKDENEEKGDE